MRRRKKQNKGSILIVLIEILLLIAMVVSGIKIYSWLRENNKNKVIINEVSENIFVDDTKDVTDEEKYKVDFIKLKQINSDIVGYLKLEGTKIDYPVVKTKDNEFYLTHNLEKEQNSAGWIFMDYKNTLDGNDKNIVIYGHSRKDGSMFGSLWHTMENKWLGGQNNKYVTLVTENKTYIYEVFSVYTIAEEDYYIKTNFSGNEFESFINTMKQRSVVAFDTEVSKDDKIITLSTCYLNDDNRMVLHAKQIVK